MRGSTGTPRVAGTTPRVVLRRVRLPPTREHPKRAALGRGRPCEGEPRLAPRGPLRRNRPLALARPMPLNAVMAEKFAGSAAAAARRFFAVPGAMTGAAGRKPDAGHGGKNRPGGGREPGAGARLGAQAGDAGGARGRLLAGRGRLRRGRGGNSRARRRGDLALRGGRERGGGGAEVRARGRLPLRRRGRSGRQRGRPAPGEVRGFRRR